MTAINLNSWTNIYNINISPFVLCIRDPYKQLNWEKDVKQKVSAS